MAGRIGYNGSDKWKIKATELLNEGGGGGTDDYDDLENKPSINNVELSGNKTAAELGMYTKSEVDTSLANKMDLNATNGSISNLNILGNYGIGNVENGGRVYITGWQNKYRGFNFPEIAIGSYDAENDTFSSDISMNTNGLWISNLDFDCFGNHGQGSVRTLDVHIDSSQFLIKEGIGDTNIIEVANTGNINVNASHVVFDSDDWVTAYAVDGFSFACDDDFEIDAVGIKIASDGITKSRALYVDANGYLVSSAVTNTELGYLSGVTSAIQTQLDGKQASITGGATTIVSSNLTASRALISNSSGKVAVSAVTSTELGYLDGVTSAIQTQLDGKLPLVGGTMTGQIILPTDSIGLAFRNGNYYTYTSHQTSGNEALVFASKQSVTSFMFVNGEDPANIASDRWQSLTPGLQIKNNCVSIGELIGNNVTPKYKLNVLGETKFVIKTCAGGGNYSYFKIATLTITSGYINGPVAFELSQRQYQVSTVQVSFASTSSKDPGLGYFQTDWDDHYYIVKESTSTWGLYGKYSETYGRCELHRITGCIYNDGVTVTVNMTNASSIPSGYTQASYGTLARDSELLGGASADTAATANTVVKRTADKYVYASFFNTTTGNYNPASYTSYPAFISSDGFLRRSSLANFQKFLQMSDLVIARKKAYNVETVGHSTAIAADTISGYKFLCWVHCSTNGWVGNCYVQNPIESSTNLWNATYGQTLKGSVYVTALYIRNI